MAAVRPGSPTRRLPHRCPQDTGQERWGPAVVLNEELLHPGHQPRGRATGQNPGLCAKAVLQSRWHLQESMGGTKGTSSHCAARDNRDQGGTLGTFPLQHWVLEPGFLVPGFSH